MSISSRVATQLLTLLGLAAVAAIAVAMIMPPGPRAADAPATDFSAARAFTHVEQVSRTPHVAGSAANDAVRDYLLQTLQGMGIRGTVQDAIGMESEENEIAAARVRNVVAVIPGSASTGRVFLVAHYDSVQTGGGANDDGAGVSAILESVRALKAGPGLRNDLVLLLTDAEEACLCGAEAFVSQHELAADGGVVLNVEARGSSGPAVMFETSTGNADLISVFGKNAPHPVGTSFAVEVYRILPNDTDFTPFRESGRFTGLNAAYIDGSAVYHAPQDTADRMDQASLQQHGDNLLALARAFGDADLAGITGPGSTDASYFPAFGMLVRYPGWLVWPLAILGLLAMAALAWVTVRAGLSSVKGVFAGLGLALIPIAVAPVLVQLFWMVMTAIRPGYAALIDPWRPGWFRWAVVALVVATLLGWCALVQRKLTGPAVVIGGLAWLAIFGMVMAATVPGGSYLVTLPVIAAALAALAPEGRPRAIAAGVAAVIAVVILAPTIALFFPALGLATGGAPAAFCVLLGLALLPVLIPLPRAGIAALSALGLFVAFAVTGLVVDRFDDRHPIPSQLMYALDTDTGKAMWASGESSPGEWTSQFVSTETDLEETYPILGTVWTGPAESATLPAPLVTVAGDDRVGEDRLLRLKIQPQRQVRLVYAEIRATGGTVRSVTVAGRPVTGELTGDKVGLLFHAPPAEGIEVTLVLRAATAVSVRAMDGSDGLSALPGFKTRPSNVDAMGSHSSELVLVAHTYRF